MSENDESEFRVLCCRGNDRLSNLPKQGIHLFLRWGCSKDQVSHIDAKQNAGGSFERISLSRQARTCRRAALGASRKARSALDVISRPSNFVRRRWETGSRAYIATVVGRARSASTQTSSACALKLKPSKLVFKPQRAARLASSILANVSVARVVTVHHIGTDEKKMCVRLGVKDESHQAFFMPGA